MNEKTEYWPDETIAYVMNYLSEHSDLKHLFVYEPQESELCFTIYTEDDKISEWLVNQYTQLDFDLFIPGALYWGPWSGVKYRMITLINNSQIISQLL